MDDFSLLPTPADDDTESPSNPSRLPNGHPPLPVGDGDVPATCPFAAIQAVLNQQAAERTDRFATAASTLHPVREDGLPATGSKTETERSPSPKRGPKNAKSRAQAAQDIGLPQRLDKNNSSARLDGDSVSVAQTFSKIAGSSASQSKKSRRSRRSKSSASKSKQTVGRRTRKAPTFSSWEAQTYIPPIKNSWSDILSTVSIEELGVVFYDKLFHVGGHEIEHMFTTDKSIMAVKFAEMLASIVGSVDNPYSMYEKLQGLAPMHVTKGVGKQHLPVMGQTLFSVLETVLAKRFTVQVRTAWEWLWAWLGATFTQSLEEAGNEVTLIGTAWNMAMDNYPDETLGDLFFDTLFELAPNLRAVFGKPRQILSVKFVEMLSTLVSFHKRLDGYNQQLVWLGIRHVAYKAKFSHVEVLGEVLVATVATAVGEEWSEEMEEAWRTLWAECCDKLLTVATEAEKYGPTVQRMWREVQQRTSRQHFGSAIRKQLLSGTEWVQSLSTARRVVVQDRGTEEGKGGRKGGSSLVNNRRRSTERSVSDKEKQVLMQGSSSANVSNTSLSGLGSPLSQNSGGGGEGGGGGGGEKSQKQTDAEAIGNQFWEFVSVCLDLLWEPERQNEQLTLMTLRFFKAGIRTSHLATIGTAIENACRQALDLGWSSDYADAWGWTWQMLEKGMTRTLRALEFDHASIVRESWERCKQRTDTIDLGESIFKELATVAPYLVHLFKRPKRIQAQQFVTAVDILVTFLEDPDQFFVELKQLTIRHIKYGVKADYVKAFGSAVLRGVQHAIGKEEWTNEVASAWTLLWDRVANCLARCLNAGTNPVIVALVNGDLEKAQEAMDCAPRAERFDTLTRVDVNGEVLSPLYWAIRDGMRDIAIFFLQDLLSIRADRHTYYYGREKLFETHPDIVEVLCKDPGAEVLLDTLLDGLMWHSSSVTHGKLRVNYYIRELYGDPEQQPNVWKSALATLSLHAPPPIFDHPVCQRLLQSKWNAYGRSMFMTLQACYALICILYYEAFVAAHDQRCGHAGMVRIVTGAFAAVTAIAHVTLATVQWRAGLTGQIQLTYPTFTPRMCRRFLPSALHLPRTLMNAWNVSRIPTYAVLTFLAFSDVCVSPDTQPDLGHRHSTLKSLVALALGVLFLELLLMQSQIAAFMLSIRTLLPDVLRSLGVILLLLVSFAGALVVAKAQHFASFGDGVATLISSQLNLEVGLFADGTAYSITLVSVLVVLVQVVVLNVLIAQLVNKSSAIAHWTHLEVAKQFAYACVEMESLLPLSHRIRKFRDMGFDRPLDFDNTDDGPSGGVQLLEPASVRSDPKYVADRIQRFTGEASDKDPWPSRTINAEEEEEEEED